MTEFKIERTDFKDIGGDLYVKIPNYWKGLEKDSKPYMLINDIIILIPQYVINATGEFLMYKIMEGLIELGIISVDDIQKASEHFV